jgi:two-component system, chemotaxis family, chemotaxis protein CheY
MPTDKNMKILVVDDYPMARRLVKNHLVELGFHDILLAEDGEKAIEILKIVKVDFVITDRNMPEMSGMELLKIIRSTPEWKEIPVLMITAETLQKNVIEAIAAGANNYIIKPFEATTLEEKINIIFEEEE